MPIRQGMHPSTAAHPAPIRVRTTISVAPEVVLRRYCALADLSAADTALLRSLMNNQISVPAGREMECEGMPTRTPYIILSGWACHFRILSDGRRMITGFLLPGDTVGSCTHARSAALVSTAAITTCRVLDATPVYKAVSSCDPAHTRLAEAQRMLQTLDEIFLLDHVVRLGRQTASERICHLLMEICWRLQTVGLGSPREFVMPLTQEALSDAVGLSVVHVNRTLQDLRRRGLIAVKQGRVALLEPDLIAAVGQFRVPFARRSASNAQQARTLPTQPH